MANTAQTNEICELVVQVKGEVLASNLSEFRHSIRQRLAAIKSELKTDEDFAQASDDTKLLKSTEDGIKTAKEQALKQAEDLDLIFRNLDEVSEEVRQKRLALEKLVKSRKEELKKERVAAAAERLGQLQLQPQDVQRHLIPMLQAAIKGKQSVAGIDKALEFETAQIVHEISACRSMLNAFEKAHGSALIMDRRALEFKPVAQLELELQRRLDLHKAEEARKAAEAEAAAARKQAQAAQQAVAERDAPPSRPTARPVAPAVPAQAAAGVDAETEWQQFATAVKAALGQLRPLREALRHEENIERAKQFAGLVGMAWQEVQP